MYLTRDSVRKYIMQSVASVFCGYLYKSFFRYFLAVLPHRGSRAFQAFLESLQEANAQHLVDLLLQQAGAMNLEELLKVRFLKGLN